MNIKKFLAIILCTAFMISMAAMPTMAADTEFTVEFLGIGSNGIAYDDIALPQTTSAGDEITWSTNSDVVAVSDDNTTAKIVKYDADKNLDASLIATVNGTPNTINFKVGYLYAEKAEKWSQNFDNFTATLPSSNFAWRDGLKGEDTMSVDNGMLKVNRKKAESAVLDILVKPGDNTCSTGSHVFEFDLIVESSLGGLIMRMPAATGQGAYPAEIVITNAGLIKVRNGSTSVDTKKSITLVSENNGVKTFKGKITVVTDRNNSTYVLLVDNNVIVKDYKFRGTTYATAGNIRIYADTKTNTYGSLWLDNISVSEITDAFDGLDKATLNEEATTAGTDTDLVTAGLALPASVTAGSVAWAGSGSLDNEGKPVNQSFFEQKTGTVTATVTGEDSTTYSKGFTFNVAAAEFDEASTATVTKSGDSVTAKISDLTVADGELTVILAAYNTSGTSAKLADVKLTKQEVADDGTLTVTISDLSSDVTDASTYKMFVFDSETSLTPLTTVTVE